ncbi:hypothetical protein [Rhodanobacter sp. C03]|uniref:hypothetical protein n=1 Tax=Rhodanobacter sp. C03 TaxID=1945858 RepID=UPI00098560D4|nr:hypothetical protein [Rhodanobacter sp. C03]OOG58398.1 hypothetical protein B0E48_06180 [Rhodanobacter sp. C03]
MNASRIPDFANKSHKGMSIWFAEMSLRGLLFHPEDAPNDIFTIATNERTFTPAECAKLDGIMADMFALFGDDVCEAACPIFMKCMGMQQAA